MNLKLISNSSLFVFTMLLLCSNLLSQSSTLRGIVYEKETGEPSFGTNVKIKGTGILNGIVFKSFSTSLANIVEKIPLQFINEKNFFLKKLTAVAVSCELYEKYNILTSINDSVNSNHLSVSPALIVDHKSVDYFFNSLDSVLKEGVGVKSFEVILNFLKSRV